MKKLVLLSGVAGSGKSTYIKKHNPYPGSIILECDAYRKKVTGSFKVMPKDTYKEVYDVVIKEANALKDQNKDIVLIIDSTFLTKERRNYFMERLKGFDEYELIIFHTSSPEINLKKNKMRSEEKRVPEDVVVQMWNSFETPDEEEKKLYNKINVIEITE